MEFNHYSVMLAETVKQLHIKPDGIYVDGTLGGAGHAFQVCSRLDKGHFYGIDQDDAAIGEAQRRLAEFGDKVTLLHNNYGNAKAALGELGVEKVDGILLDLGVSSYQLDTQERGFSYRYNSELDMRMDRRQTFTAKDIVNDYTQQELYRMIRDYGEETFAKNIAKHIVQARNRKTIETTFELNDIIQAAIPAKMRQNGHPSKRTYQAIRIECNRELEVLRSSLSDLIGMLNPEGRICIITFHSLEDRIVKTTFKNAENPCTCPPEFPMCVCGKKPFGKVITKKPVLPGEEELAANKRSKSAKLRVLEKI